MEDQPAKYTEPQKVHTEHWVCDGKSIFEFDATQKLLKQRVLPQEMQGNSIVNGPLPFLFGARADEIKERYWVRVVVPPPQPGRFWLEAIPKHKEDAANARRVSIIIDEEEFLPEGLVLDHPGSSRTTFKFANREVNKKELLDKLNIFHREFYEPRTPVGWKKVVDEVQQ